MQITRIYDTVADYQKSFDLINRGYAPEQRSAGQYFETTEEIYTYFLNVLPRSISPQTVSACRNFRLEA